MQSGQIALVETGQPAPVNSLPGPGVQVGWSQKTLGASHQDIGDLGGEGRRREDAPIGDRPICPVLFSEDRSDNSDLFRGGERFGTLTLGCALQ
jgi:hypothetical protein